MSDKDEQVTTLALNFIDPIRGFNRSWTGPDRTEDRIQASSRTGDQIGLGPALLLSKAEIWHGLPIPLCTTMPTYMLGTGRLCR